jgi:hypothetical protein
MNSRNSILKVVVPAFRGDDDENLAHLIGSGTVP